MRFKNYLINEAVFKNDETKYIPLVLAAIEKGPLLLGPQGKNGSIEIKQDKYFKQLKKDFAAEKIHSLKGVVFTGVDGNTYKWTQFFKGTFSGHFRKDSTAASNVNEVFSLYFLSHTFVSAEHTLMELESNKKQPSGIYTGEGKMIRTGELLDLVLGDASYENDLQIAANNAAVLKQDFKEAPKKLFWTPRAKPYNMDSKHPADIVIEFNSGLMGYSNKAIATKEDTTPKLNTNIVAGYKRISSKNLSKIEQLVDNTWEESYKQLPQELHPFFDFNIKDEGYSEKSSSKKFLEIGKQFRKLGYDFNKLFYYQFRNNMIKNYISFLQNEKHFKEFLYMMGVYTYGELSENQVPYKLLIGSTKKSTIKDVTNDIVTKNILFKPNIQSFDFKYDGKSQSFNIEGIINNKRFIIPFTLRTRVGGLLGKSLYITTSGMKYKK